ncbi:50S ribosomal protein L29 [Candidatus Dependentiae bacterium]
MNKEEMKRLGLEDLNNELTSLKKQLFELKLKTTVGQGSDFSRFKKLRVQIARALTFINQKSAG